MAYDSRVYRVLIASPSDVEEEREIAVRVIQEWNDLYSYSRKVVLLPLRWETHTAPEYGTRPQEVINRAIVDQCDLLVGIFWTRIGSPTGIAESGTLEEIERVGKAEKPVMLYFSKVEIDPDKIDYAQIERLRQFKATTYPKGLIENYRKLIEFRDKFARQLELKLRDLQRSDSSGVPPLSLQFLSDQDGQPVGDKLSVNLERLVVSGTEVADPDKKEKLEKFIQDITKSRSYAPVALGITNSSSSGIRNLYIELQFGANNDGVEITDSPEPGIMSGLGSEIVWFGGSSREELLENKMLKRVEPNLKDFEKDRLRSVGSRAWRLTYEWDAIQPHRVRLVRPVVYVYCEVLSEISISAKVFADSFPEPLELRVTMIIDPVKTKVELATLLPKWEELLDKYERANTPLLWRRLLATHKIESQL